MKLKFYLLDVTYEVVGREPHIIMWGIDEKGNRIVLRDRSFRPYFYAVLDENTDVNEVKHRIQRLSKPRSPIISVNEVSKKYFGEQVKALRITTVIPETVREYREEVKRIQGVREVLEADIRFSMRYIIDHQLIPCGWHEVEVEQIPLSPQYKGRISAEYLVKSPPRPLGAEELRPPNLRILAFDIEVYSKQGSPRPDRDPVIIISVMNDRGEVKIFEAEGYNDRKVIQGFVDYVLEYDPDIIVGYNSNRFDWPYLVERAKYLGIRLDVGRRKDSMPTTSVYGHVSIAGRLNVDLYDFAEEIHEIKVKSLENVADYLGVMKKSERVLIEWYQIPEYWDNPEKRKLLVKYAEDDVRSTYGLSEKFLPFAIQLSMITGLPLDQVGAASVGFRLEWYLMRSAYLFNELIPNRVERPYEPYTGAIVLEPKRGVHENIAVLDFSSMYPNIMIKYNVGPDTLVRDPSICEKYGCWIAPEVGHRFRKEPPGFFKKVLETLLKLRREVRAKMKEYPVDSVEYRILDERQRALKVLANAAYGYMGWVGARWYCREGAEAVTAWGRQTIKKAIEIARSLGLKVIYGDTDSLFVTYDEAKIKEFIRRVEQELGFEIKVDKIYRRVFFTEAKKRYAGLLEDGRIDIVGFEAVRGDWTEIAKEVQERIVEIVLGKGDTREAIEYVRKVIKELKEGRIPLEKLIIWKTLSKKIEEYGVDAPHVVAAKRMIEAGYQVSKGDKIGYVIVRGSGKLSSRAYPYFMVKPSDIDFNYYIDHQVIPAALRILGYFGITEKQLKATATGQKSLFDFFAKK